MKTITTVGMFPLALGLEQGGEFLQPLGIVVFSESLPTFCASMLSSKTRSLRSYGMMNDEIAA
jgi:hypothetical protein